MQKETKKYLHGDEITVLKCLERVFINKKLDSRMLVESVESGEQWECLFSEIGFRPRSNNENRF